MNEQRTLIITYFSLCILFFTGCNKKVNNQSLEDKTVHISDSIYNLVYNTSTPSKLKAVDDFKSFISNNTNDSVTRENLLKISGFYHYLNEIDKSIITTKSIIKLSKKARDSLHLMKSYKQLSKYYSIAGKADSAYYYLIESGKLALSIDNLKWQSKTLHSKSVILSHAKSYAKAKLLAVQAFEIAESIDDELLKYQCLNLLGMVLSYQEEFNKSERYHKRALAQIPNITHLPHYHEILKGQSYKNLGLNKLAAEDYPAAKEHFEKGLNIPDIKSLHPGLYADLLDYHSFSRFKLGELESPTPLLRALRIRDSISYPVDVVISKNHLAQFYFKHHEQQKALVYNLQAYQLAKEIKNTDQEIKSLHLLTQTDPKQSEQHFRQYIHLNDSILLEERRQQEKFALIDFETEKIKKEKELAEAKTEKLRIERWFLLSGLGFLVLLGTGGMYILRQKSKHRELKHINEQRAAKEELYELMIAQNINLEKGKHQERQRISRELHDGVLGRLSGIRLNMFSLKMKQDTETINKALIYIDSIQEVEKEIRSISHDLASPQLSMNSDFRKLLKNLLITELATSSGQKYSCTIDETINWKNINHTIKLTIYRIVQEALHNIKKHANANYIQLDVSQSKNNLHMYILDNGIGFDDEKSVKGIGLKNMIQRAKEVNGSLNVNSSKSTGTKIILNIPI